jgi:hypothetical protein
MAVPSASAASTYKTLCSSIPGSDDAGGIYPATGGAFVEDFDKGNLVFCNASTHASKTIAFAPSGGSGGGYSGMGGVTTSTFGLVLALTDDNYASQLSGPGLWLCKHASTSGCGKQSSFIFLPSTFCSSEPARRCFPTGTALDSSLNLYYADPDNAQVVECTAASKYQSCTSLPGSSAFSSYAPTGLFLHGTTFYVADNSCAGKVWKGTKSSFSVIASLGESLDSITVSTKNPSLSLHVYVGVNGKCFSGDKALIIDLKDSRLLPTPFTSSADIYGLDSSLQFTSVSTTYQTTDTI